jgi:WD40 repeat protein
LAALGKNRLASGSTDKTIIIWNIHNGRIIRTINDIVEAESPKLSHVHLLRLPGEKLVHGSDYDVIKFWNIAQFGKHVSKHDGFSNGISSMTMLNDGSTLAIAPLDSNEAIRLVNINTGRIKSIWGNVNQHELAVLENGRLISAASDDSIIIWK